MEKQKMKLVLFVCVAFLASMSFADSAKAVASATVSWAPPTTDEGGGALTGLAGYKIFYKEVSPGVPTWLNMVGTCLLGTGTEIIVPGGATSSYRIQNILTAGSTYNFTVAAYDDASTPNVSRCALTAGSLEEFQYRVSYTGDINRDFVVNGGDVTTLAGVYFTNNSASDVNKDGTVNGGDVSILQLDYLAPQL